ncbi:glycoside hydrolase family 75 protein [Streptomyces sp. NPDC048111]|uniref:glycoside hydrolase family 75 protein n=1 Tax=Streptomyces sp. NPDC048111 TaxID=3365500 RepID=UPI003724B873
MRSRPFTLALASGAALLAAAALPATARGADAVPSTARDPAAAVAPAAGADNGPVGAAQLLAKTQSCAQISHGKYRTDPGAEATVPVCGLNGAVFWTADLDIDCDGRVGKACNKKTDPWFQPETRFHQSNDTPLDAERLPYVVVPGASARWDHAAAGITGGTVAAVVYNNSVEYAVVGDTGPTATIGEASYATAKALGIDPTPRTGGAPSGVTYILFRDSRSEPIESHDATVALGRELAQRFLAAN